MAAGACQFVQRLRCRTVSPDVARACSKAGMRPSSMDIYKELDLITDFEERVGNREAVIRASDLMVSYLAAMTTPIPEIAARGLRTAVKYREGSARRDEVES